MIEVVIQAVSWQTHETPLKAIRQVVFVEEQDVPLSIEWDKEDANALHLLAYLKTDTNFASPIGCARLLTKALRSDEVIGKIGRMAVLKNYRGLGLGKAMLQKAVAIHFANGINNIQLSAQLHAIPFYINAGFEVISEVYQDANIPHRDMRLTRSALPELQA
jgi:predicted GNAT family N-acyltransferase